MSASPWWLAVRMCCIFVLDLMPNLLSNNDCTDSVSDEKKSKGIEWALIPPCYRGTGSQQELYDAAVWFWHFLNVVSETCQSLWFNMACCCSWSPGAYMKLVPARKRQAACVYINYWFWCVEIHVGPICNKHVYANNLQIHFPIIDTCWGQRASLSQNGAFALIYIGVLLEINNFKKDTKLSFLPLPLAF